MKPVNVGGHAAYQNRYSVFGPEPRLPSDMLRSVLVSVEFQFVSYTKWAADLKENHLHVILSGFLVGDTPGVGTFADSFSRLWISDKNNLSDPIHPPKEKPQKPKDKGEKAPPVGKVTVEDLFRKFEDAPPQDMNPCKRIFEIFRSLFLDRSAQEGLIDLRNLSLSGDGTPIYTAARERKKRTCESSCSDAKYGRTVHLVMKDNPRLFNDPPRSSKEWKEEYNARTSSERCNKRQKIDYKLEDGRYRSSKMWYCRLFSILMHGLCQRPRI